MADNDFKGIIFETEADTLAKTFKQEWGNFSDVLRKAFHHESASLYRRKENEFIEILNPQLAIVLSGTPRQVHNMMPDTENGLFSRFLFYAFADHSPFRNPFISPRQIDYPDYFLKRSKEVFTLYERLLRLPRPLSFRLTPEQGRQFTEEFNRMLDRNNLLLGNDFVANTKRLGLITFRIAMILSALRLIGKKSLQVNIGCDDKDFTTALSIALTLEKHAIEVYRNLPASRTKEHHQEFLEALPQSFDRKTYLRIAAEIGIRPKNADKLIALYRSSRLNYQNHQYSKIPV